MNSKIRIGIVALVAAMSVACSAALYLPTADDAKRSGATIDNLRAGRSLYVQHCGSCHNLYLPEQFTREHWEKVIPEMKRKAHLTEQEAALISRFIYTRSKPE